mgnify:CR=1 FL=1
MPDGAVHSSLTSDAAIAVVANARAGSVARLGEDRIRQLVAAGSASCTLTWSEPEQLEEALDLAFSSGAAAVAVIGGDGTIRSAAKRSLQSGVPIAPLPGGTLNILPKLALGHADLEAAIEEMPRWIVRDMDVGVIGGEPFFLTAACGFAGALARMREAWRPPRTWSAVSKATVACLQGFGPSLRGGVRYQLGGDIWRNAHTLVLAVGSVERVVRADLYQDKSHVTLQAWALAAQTPLQLLRTAWQATGNWRDAAGLDVGRAEVIGLRLGNKRPLVVLDGEPVRLSRASEARLMPGALKVLGPPLALNTDQDVSKTDGEGAPWR